MKNIALQESIRDNDCGLQRSMYNFKQFPLKHMTNSQARF